MELERKERFRFYRLCWEEKEGVLGRLRELLLGRGEIVLAVVFGSFLKDYLFRDVDIAVYVSKSVDPLDYKLSLERELSKHISYPVDVTVLNMAPPWLIKKIIEEGRTVLVKQLYITEKIYLKAIDAAQLTTRPTQTKSSQQG